MKINSEISAAVDLSVTAGYVKFSDRHPDAGQWVSIKWCPPYEGVETEVEWNPEAINWSHECIPCEWKPFPSHDV